MRARNEADGARHPVPSYADANADIESHAGDEVDIDDADVDGADRPFMGSRTRDPASRSGLLKTVARLLPTYFTQYQRQRQRSSRPSRQRYHAHAFNSAAPMANGKRYNPNGDDDSPSLGTTIKRILYSSWINVFLVFVPIGIATYVCGASPLVTFTCNAIAIIPLSSLLAYATQCLASELGDTLGALINISFGNLIEVIMFVLALAQGEVHVVQGALVGSVLVNLLLVLGCSIIVGEFRTEEVLYDMKQAQALSCLLSLSVFSILIPISFHYSFKNRRDEGKAVDTMSRASAMIMLVIYFIYLAFLFKPRKRNLAAAAASSPPVVLDDIPEMALFSENGHDRLSASAAAQPRSIKFMDEGQEADNTAGVEMSALGNSNSRPGTAHSVYTRSRSVSLSRHYQLEIAERYDSSSHAHPHSHAHLDVSGTDVDEIPMVSRSTSIVLLISSSLLVAVCSEFLVDNISIVTKTSGLTDSFIGLIILPVAGNAAEFITAVAVAARGKPDLALGVSFGSSIQIALFVSPLMVIVGWVMGSDMNLDFGLFDTVVLVGSALLVNVLISNGRTNYLEGSLLCACYGMVCVGAFLSP